MRGTGRDVSTGTYWWWCQEHDMQQVSYGSASEALAGYLVHLEMVTHGR